MVTPSATSKNITFEGRRAEFGRFPATLDTSGGNGGEAVTFAQTFASPPEVLVSSNLNDTGATYSAGSITQSGFTLTVSSSNTTAAQMWVFWVALAPE